MKNMLKNKKGFTLVELLAVIVILALLIVITANTVLPMMNKSKANAMVVYAERVLNTASASFQADQITSTADTLYYSIGKLMGESNYYGCVAVTAVGDSYTYKILMIDPDNKWGIRNTAVSTVTSLVPSGSKAENVVIADVYKNYVDDGSSSTTEIMPAATTITNHDWCKNNATIFN